ncbi:ninjurin-2-like isoform X2 [Dermatophagoides pteronyssinus]|uniref:ninjurin-2-like isoform X2 n=1 Tax=Dermatophagoides pteronyssinus TaxID=6956 RepID=UPI003F6625B2
MERIGIQPGKSRINTNSYATKKTISQGLFDVALLTANASQLKHTLTLGDKSRFYLLMVILIGASILLQVLVGIIFIYLGYHNIEHEQRQKRLNNLNNITTILVFIITVINVFISGFAYENDGGRIDDYDLNNNNSTSLNDLLLKINRSKWPLQPQQN